LLRINETDCKDRVFFRISYKEKVSKKINPDIF